MTMTLGGKKLLQKVKFAISLLDLIFFFFIRFLKNPLVIVSPVTSKDFGQGKLATNNLEQDTVARLYNTFAD